jgi:N-methylhydantoinase A
VFPAAGAAMSAVGGLLSPLSDDYSEFCVTTSHSFDRTAVNTAIDRLQSRCETFLGQSEDGMTSAIEYSVEARYAQQIWEIKLPIAGHRFRTDEDLERLCHAFHRLHDEIFSFSDPKAEIEFINWRASVMTQHPHRPDHQVWSASALSAPEPRPRLATFAGTGRVETMVHRLERLPTGLVHKGPAIVETPLASIVIEPGATFHRRPTGSLIVDPVVEGSGPDA